MTLDKVEQIFYENNQDCVPDWLAPFQSEVQKKGTDLLKEAKDF